MLLDRRAFLATGSAALAVGLRDDWPPAAARRLHAAAAGQGRRRPGRSAPSPACGPIAPPASSSAARRSATRRWSTITAMAAPGSRLSWGSSGWRPTSACRARRAGRGDRRRRMGLTTARLVQEAGFPVTIYAAALPPDTTSNIAGGQIHPFGSFSDEAVTPEWRGAVRRGDGLQLAALPDHGRRRLRHPLAADLSRRRDAVGAEPLRAISVRQRASLRRPSIRSRSTTSSAIDTMYVETGALPAPDDARRPDRRRQDRGAPTSPRRRRSPPCPRRWCSTAPASARASCSATRSCARCAASSRSCCRSPKCATPSPAAPATCSRAPTASCSAALRARRVRPNPEPGDDRADHRVATAALRRIPLRRLKSLRRAPI